MSVKKIQCYQCINCKTYYAEENVTHTASGKTVVIAKAPANLICSKPACKLMGICTEVDETIEQILDGIIPPPPPAEVGLCVFLMDASGSMGEHAFSTRKLPSNLNPPPHPNDNQEVEAKGFMSKREMVALATAQAIFDSRTASISMRESAYIGIVMYDHAQKPIFFKSVQDIYEKYSDSVVFANMLLKEMKNLNGGTDITGALNFVNESLVKKFSKGKIEILGQYSSVKQFVPLIYDANTGEKGTYEETKEEPNIRVMLYTDGEQLAEYGALQSPFKPKSHAELNATPEKGAFNFDPLICAYIGQGHSNGAKELRTIANYCPVHGNKQFILIDKINALPTLRGIFRMASGGSGYCEQCLTGKPVNDPYAKKPTSDY